MTSRFSLAFEELGFTRETVTILHLVPLVQVAWSDGGVSEGEHSKIREIAALRGMMPGAPGYVLLEKLLHTRPSERVFDVCWSVIRAMFASWPEEKRRALEVSLPACAVEVASILGGLLGFRSISANERTAVERVAREIAEAHAEGTRTLTAGASVGAKPTRGARLWGGSMLGELTPEQINAVLFSEVVGRIGCRRGRPTSCRSPMCLTVKGSMATVPKDSRSG